jgi:hypothetical protein
MRQVRYAGLVILALLCALGAWLVFPARRGDEACRPITLRAAGTGAIIQGTEDLALDPAHGRLIVSAYDRRSDKPSGLYVAALSALDADTAPVTASPLMLKPERALRPHGIALAERGDGGAWLYVINRLKGRAGRTAELLAFRLDGLSAALAYSLPLPCGANDLLPLAEGHVLVTVDRSVCSGPRRWLADALNLIHGRVIEVGADGAERVLAAGIDFANGIEESDGLIYVAATRARALLVYDRKALLEGPAPATPLGTIKLSGAPDNLSRGSDGRLYVAAHRSLLRFAAYLGGWRGDSPGDVYVYDPAARMNGLRHLFRLARILDGPTSAVESGGLVIVGGGFSAGLAVCKESPEVRS